MQRRPLRDINDWGTVDIEALTMSIRSRLATELSYALTTFTLLSTMKGQTPGSGFPIFQCVDLLDEALDLLEDEAFHGEEETLDSEPAEDSRITTHRQLVKMVFEEESEVFAGLTHRPWSNNPNFGSRQRPGGIILTITNIIRNLSIIPDNISFLAQHERLLDLMLRVCTVTHDGCKPLPASPVLSPSDLIIARKDVLYTLINLTGMIQFSTHSTRMMRVASRAFTLVASYLIDPAECVSPLAYIQQSGVPPNGNLKPPPLSDIALEVFTRLSQSDSNRQVLSQILSQTTVWSLLEALVHRLPILDADFQLVARELWLSYVEKIVMAIYSLAFLAPPQLKLKIKTDRNLGFTKVMFRMVQKFLTNPHPDGRVWFAVCARRAIEAMKVVDDGEDVFDTSQTATLPTISFGMGYGEVGESDKQTGTGLLGGYREVTWDLLMLREVDDVMFAELESMARVG
jgi:SWI/SNF chromatin-remodeling complex subunit SWI1